LKIKKEQRQKDDFIRKAIIGVRRKEWQP